MVIQNTLFGEPERNLDEEKACDQCHAWFPLTAFDGDPTKKDLYDHRCKECKADEARLRTHGLTPECMDLLMRKQSGRCGSCGVKQGKEEGEVKKLNIDHCHETGRIRGLLCRACNTGLGLIGDTYRSVKNMEMYLRESL